MTAPTAAGLPPLPTSPSDGKFPAITRQQTHDWISLALAGVDQDRADHALITTLDQHPFGIGDEILTHLAALIWRARQTERAQVVSELTADTATQELLAQTRNEAYSDGMTAGRTEAEAIHAHDIAARDRADREAQQRRREAWTTLLGDAK